MTLLRKQIILQKQDCLAVTLEAEADIAFDTGHARIGDLPEALALGNIGDVHLHRRDRHRLECVEDGDAGVGVGRGIVIEQINSSNSIRAYTNERPLSYMDFVSLTA